MKRNNPKRKKRSMIVFVLTFAIMLLVSPSVIYASTQYDLPSSAKVYCRKQDKDGNLTNKWVKMSTETFKYDKKGNISKYTRDEGWDDGSYKSAYSIKWAYKKGKISRKTVNGSYKSPNYSSTSKEIGYYNKNGRIIKANVTNSDSKNKEKSVYTHNKKGWVTKISFPDYKDAHDLKMSYHKNGMPKTLSRTIPSSETYLFTFNKKGLATKYGIDGLGTSKKFTYSYDKKGRVKTCFVKTEMNGKFVTEYKIVYKYGKSKTTDKRVYFGIMNRGTPAPVSIDVVPDTMTKILYLNFL